MSVVLGLEEAKDVKTAGGKGASLSNLIQAGFNVPKGFIVTAAVQTEADVEKEILNAFDFLNTKYVAVRSSAATEDGSKDAWAGQLDTFLNVSRGELLEKIRLCQQSAKSERAKSYAKQKNLKAGAVAVIVQEMVQGETSGVAFSAHPVTANHQQIVIEAVHGLGEKMVSGSVTPDTYVIDKKTGSVIERYLQTKKQILGEKQIKELAETIVKIEKFFGFPVDVEWTFAKTELFILQSRPITTLG